jgi:hypothetical protein
LTYGALLNHIWSFAGDDFTGGASRNDVNATFLQPFVAYTTANAVTYTVNLEASANWEAEVVCNNAIWSKNGAPLGDPATRRGVCRRRSTP